VRALDIYKIEKELQEFVDRFIEENTVLKEFSVEQELEVEEYTEKYIDKLIDKLIDAIEEKLMEYGIDVAYISVYFEYGKSLSDNGTIAGDVLGVYITLELSYEEIIEIEAFEIEKTANKIILPVLKHD